MSGSNRNAPCPCGSGKKYKRCCGVGNVVELPAWSKSERERVMEMLTAMVTSDGFAGAYGAAYREFFGRTLDEATREQAKEILDDKQTDGAFTTYLLYDAYITDDKHRFMESLLHGRLLRNFTAGQIRYLERMAASCMRPYAVRELHLDRGFVLRDLWSDADLDVKEALLTRYVDVGSTFFTRIIEGPHGENEIFGAALELAPSTMEDLLSSLRASLRAKRRKRPQLDETTFFKEVMPRIAQAWLARFLWTMPALATSDGEPMSPEDLYFDVLDRDALHAALMQSGEFDWDGKDEYVWAGGPSSAFGGGVLLGSLTIEDTRLHAFVMSSERAQRLRALLDRIASRSIRYRLSERHDIAAELVAARRDRRQRPPAPKHVPSAEESAIIGPMMADYYARWIDLEVPALGGRTPRHAARLKTQRAKVAALLREIEMHGNRAGGTFDPTPLWEELGLLDLR